MTPKNILHHELIGLRVEIVDARNKALVGLHGEIVDETKFTLIIKTPRGEKRVLKNGAQFLTDAGKQEVIIAGERLVGRPEERIKK